MAQDFMLASQVEDYLKCREFELIELQRVAAARGARQPMRWRFALPERRLKPLAARPAGGIPAS